MNWLDFIFIAIIILGAFMGLRIGLIGATFTVAGIIIGALLAGQFSDDIGAVFDASISNDTVVTVISYIVIIILAIAVARIAARIVRKIISLLLLGFADRLGGLAVGIIAGLILSWAVSISLTRLTYDFEIPTAALPGVVVERLPSVVETRQVLEDALTGSSIIPMFISLSDFLPASAFGIVPADFKDAFDILDLRIESLKK